MIDTDTFLTTLYVMVDDFCQSRPHKGLRPGPDASLSPSEVITLAIFARWSRFASERDFYRYADSRLRDAFPTLPESARNSKSARAPLPRSYRGFRFALDGDHGGSEMPLRSSGQLG